MVFYIVGVQQGSRSAIDTCKDAQRALKNYGTAIQLIASWKI